LNVLGAVKALGLDEQPFDSTSFVGATMSEALNAVIASECGCAAKEEKTPRQIEDEAPAVKPAACSAQTPADSQLIYALGTLGYDFGSEARRDSFKQLMPAVTIDNVPLPANPHDARQMADHLGASLSEAQSLIWTLNLELTPIYALQPFGPFA